MQIQYILSELEYNNLKALSNGAGRMLEIMYQIVRSNYEVASNIENFVTQLAIGEQDGTFEQVLLSWERSYDIKD